MKSTLVIGLMVCSLLFVGCSPGKRKGADGTSCTVEQTDGGALVVCEDGSSAFLNNGLDGADGQDGLDGLDGTSCTITQNEDQSLTIACDDGTEATVVPGIDGRDGVDGQNGVDGKDGVDGADGADGKDGRDGADGQDGVDGIDGVDGADGKDGADGQDGTNGVDGVDGKDGVDGQDGQSSYADFIAFATELQVKRQSVLDVRMFDVNNAYIGRCTGTKTDLGKVVTAEHCRSSATHRFAFYREGTYVGQAPVSSSAWLNVVSRDSMIIGDVVWNSIGDSMPALTPSFGYTPVIGEMIGLLSHPLSLIHDLQTTIGYVTDDEFVGLGSFSVYWSESFLADLVSAGGSSGGPVFDRDGEWVGLLVGGFIPSSGLDLSIVLPFR